jgi:glycosyltransferase involved in cell wall biosynthesis
MLSVLIPTYNYNAVALVNELHKQLLKSKVLFEIICIDDGSKSALNQQNEQINALSGTRFIELKDNVGRSAIRNYLSNEAVYTWLLFLDSDVLPVSPIFIRNYLKEIQDKSGGVFCGGIRYLASDKNKKRLRYKYGVKFEEVSEEKRNKRPYKFFFTSNFLISKETFNTIRFEEKLTKYGREDLLFSLTLKAKNHPIIHLKNEVYHLGIDDDAIFVFKTKQAMENIAFLADNNLILTKEGNLLKSVHYLSLFGISSVVGRLTPFFEKKAIKNASIFYLNCFKVSYLCSLKTAF